MQKYRIRKTRTGSGATAIQVVYYEDYQTKIAQHIGSAHTEAELTKLMDQAKSYITEQTRQIPLFQEASDVFEQIEVSAVFHRFARDVLLAVAAECGLGFLDILYRDLALMRIIEPCSKRRSIELLQRYFAVSYTKHLYAKLPGILEERKAIETAAAETAKELSKGFSLLLYDVTTLYFETHKPDDELQARGFSKDDKSKQPQIMIGLLVTAQGFPLIQEVFKGNAFEGHTMLEVVKAFQSQYHTEKPVIVADAAMLSETNRVLLEKEGYHYIVGARLANVKPSFIRSLCSKLPREDGAVIRLSYPDSNFWVVCSYSEKRYKKEKAEMDKQIEKAKMLVARREPGKRAKFVKKSNQPEHPYLFDEALRQKTEALLGMKGYCTNIPKEALSNKEIIAHYHELWHVEQAFRMSKTDLKARPIFHHSHDAIRAHALICFMALMIGKFIEIKTGLSIRAVRDLLWWVHDIHFHDPIGNRQRIVRTSMNPELQDALNRLNLKITY